MSGHDESSCVDSTVAVLVLVAEVSEHCCERICIAWYSSGCQK